MPLRVSVKLVPTSPTIEKIEGAKVGFLCALDRSGFTWQWGNCLCYWGCQ
jgi:hypothetical protein